MNVTDAGNKEYKPLIVFSAALFIGLMNAYTVPITIGALIDGLQLSPAQAGFLVMLELSTVGITAIALAPLSSRYSWLKLSIYGVCISGAAQLGSMFPEQMLMLCLFRVAAGIGHGVMLAVANSAIATSEDPEVMYGKASALVSLVFTLLLYGLPFAASYGYHRGVFFVLAIVIAMSMVFLRKLPSKPVRSVNSVEIVAVKWGRIAALFLAITSIYIGLFGVYSFVERIGGGLGLDESKIGFYLAISTVAGIGGGVFAGWLGTRVGRVVPLVSSCLISSLVCMIIAQSNSEFMYGIGVILYGVIYVFSISYFMGAGAAIDPSGRVAVAAIGYIIIVSALGSGLFGLIVTNESYADMGWPGFVLCLLAIPFVAPLAIKLDREGNGLGTANCAEQGLGSGQVK